MGLKSFLNNIFRSSQDAGKTAEEKAREGFDKVSEYTERVGKDVLEKSKPIVDKFQDTSEEIGRTILEKGKDFSGKAEQFTEDIGRKILDASDDIWKSTQQKAEDINKSSEPKRPTTSEKEDAINSLFDDEPKRHSHSDETPPTPPKEPFVPKEDPFKKYEGSNERSSHMDALKDTPGFGSSGSFFDKADRFASGDYDGVKDGPQIKKTPETTDEPVKKEDWKEPVYGFEDTDGDGDPLIDDAIIEEE